MVNCLIWFVVMVVIAGVLAWAVSALPLDPTIKQVGKVCIIILVVVVMLLMLVNCLGLHGAGFPPLR